tara:strand:- start:402 stop:695 length:294 start_codon:yes stop_codon:yes gene_type:complete
MPELRLTKYGYNFCVNCSTTEKKVGIVTTEGSGDHNYNDLLIVDASTARKIAASEAHYSGDKQALLEIIDYETDENAVSQSIKEQVHNILDADNENL